MLCFYKSVIILSMFSVACSRSLSCFGDGILTEYSEMSPSCGLNCEKTISCSMENHYIANETSAVCLENAEWSTSYCPTCSRSKPYFTLRIISVCTVQLKLLWAKLHMFPDAITVLERNNFKTSFYLKWPCSVCLVLLFQQKLKIYFHHMSFNLL